MVILVRANLSGLTWELVLRAIMVVRTHLIFLFGRPLWAIDRTILGRLSKRGNKYMRTLFIIGARAVLAKPAGRSLALKDGWLLPPSASIITS